MKLSGPARSVRNAKRLRAEMSLPEVLLWTALRGKREGVRFRRQHPAGPHSLDFYCARAKVAIEVDGEFHGGDRPASDAVRDRWLADRGVLVLRIPAAAVLNDLDAVVAYILATVGDRGEAPSTTRLAPSGPPPPVPGEE